jgi:Yip1 domain
MASATTAQPQPMSELGRLSGVLFEPSAAFRDISTHTRWWPPLAIIAVLSLGFIFMFSQRVGFDRFVRQQMDLNPKIQQMDAAQREQALAVSMKITPVIVYVAAVAALPVITLIVSAVFLLIFRTFLGAAVTFGQVFAVCCYALVPYILSSIMSFAVLMLKDPDQFDLQNPSPTNIAAFLDVTSTPKWEYSLATSIDVFTFWVLVLLATGLSVASRKISWATSLTWVVGSWALWVALKVGLAAAFS